MPFTPMEDGRMMAPIKGLPPEPPKGYCKTSNAFIFAPNREDCINAHEDLGACCAVNRLVNILVCVRTEKRIQKGDCYSCKYWEPINTDIE